MSTAGDHWGVRQILGGLGPDEGDSLVGATLVVALVGAAHDCVREDGTPQGRPLRSALL